MVTCPHDNSEQMRSPMSILDRFRLTGKRLFITGGSRGLGREMALACAGGELAVVGCDTETLERMSNESRKLGRNAFAMRADVSRMDECEAACKKALA